MDKCMYCGEDIYPDDEIVYKNCGHSAHVECSETEDPEELD